MKILVRKIVEFQVSFLTSFFKPNSVENSLDQMIDTLSYTRVAKRVSFEEILDMFETWAKRGKQRPLPPLPTERPYSGMYY